MQGCVECDSNMAVSATELPEFDRILNEFGTLVDRLRCVRETSVTISDALIGMHDTGMVDDCVKPSSPHYFVSRCFDLIVGLREEVEHLEKINTKLLHSVQVE